MSSVLRLQMPDVTQAMVVDKTRETTYRRAGHGVPVLLLAARNSVLSTELFGVLARRYRVYSPDLPPATDEAPRPDFAAWLRGFLDALGLTRISIVCDEGIGATSLAFALLEPFRVTRVVLVLRPASGESRGGVYDVLRDARVPLLLAWYSAAEGEAGLREIEEFLSFPASA